MKLMAWEILFIKYEKPLDLLGKWVLYIQSNKVLKLR